MESDRKEILDNRFSGKFILSGTVSDMLMLCFVGQKLDGIIAGYITREKRRKE